MKPNAESRIMLFPLIFDTQDDLDRTVGVLEAFFKVHRRASTFLERRKTQRTKNSYDLALLRMDELLTEMGGATVELHHRRILLKAKLFAQERTYDVARTVSICAEVIGMTSAKIRRVAGKPPLGTSPAWTFLSPYNEGMHNAEMASAMSCDLKNPHEFTRLGKHRAKLAAELAGHLADVCTESEILSMLDPIENDDVSDQIETMDSETLAVFEERQKERLASLEADLEQAEATVNEITDRLSMANEFTTEPFLNKSFFPGMGDTNDAPGSFEGSLFPRMMAFLVTVEYTRAIIPIDRLTPEPPPDALKNLVGIMAVDKYFWNVILCQMCDDCDALRKHQFADWFHSLFQQLIEHPKHFSRLSVSPDVMRARSLFSKSLVPVMLGHDRTGCQSWLDNARQSKEPNMALDVYASYLALSVSKRQADGADLDGDVSRSLFILWKKYCLPVMERILLEIRNAIIEKRYIILGAADSPDATPSKSNADNDKLADSLSCLEALEPAGQEMEWFYVRRPEYGIRDAEPVPELDDNKINDWLWDQDIKTIVKPESVINALNYYCSLPPITRAMTPKETVGHESWDKMKRGKLRILARLESGNKLFFHLYPRKEWEYKNLN